MRQELFITILSATLAACAAKAVAGDADALMLQGRTGATTLTDSKKKSDIRVVSCVCGAFHAVRLQAPYTRLHLVKGEQRAVYVRASKKYCENLSVVVTSGVLSLKTRKKDTRSYGAADIYVVTPDADVATYNEGNGSTVQVDAAGDEEAVRRIKMESGSEISILSEGAPRARKHHKPRGGSDVVCKTTTVTTTSNGCVASGQRIKTTREYATGVFSAISASALCDIHFTQGSQSSVKVVIDADEKYDVEVSNSEGCLRIERKKPLEGNKGKKQMDSEAWYGSDYVKSNNHIDVYVTSPRLGKLNLEGMASFEASTIQTPELDIELNGVGTLTVERLECDDTDLDVSGVRTVSMSILGKSLDAECSGVGSVGLSFKGEKAKFENSGMTKMAAWVDCDYLTASCSGVSTMRLLGRADNTNINSEGVSKIDTDQLNKY